MYFLEGINKVNKQFEELMMAADSDYQVNHANKKEAYLNFLNLILPQSPPVKLEDDQFLFDQTKINELIPHFTNTDLLTDLEAKLYFTPEDSMKLGLERVKSALILLNNINPELHNLFNDVIHTLFYNRSYNSGGGSVSTLVGVIWCCNRQNWSDWDTLEFLVHELTHNLVFLDEYYHVHYNSLEDVVKKENYAQSAILYRKRPLDKVFHSIIVDYEVLKLREQHGEPLDPKAHPPSKVLKKQILSAVEDTFTLLAKKDLASPRVHELLNKINKNLDNYHNNHFNELYL